MNNRGLPSSANSSWPLNKKRLESKESLQRRETDPYHLRPRNRVTKEAGSKTSGGEVQVQGGQSGPEENYLRGLAHTTRVDTTGRSPNTSVANSRSRIQGKDDPAVIVKHKVNAPGSTPDSKIVWRRIEVQRVG
ncbi:hypothetical protein TNIN_498531 [Trichonephila inaurata madagascariensis]|uniref:Uncharacterized protein n=1 Tax=Trichonephila inaurata madagascariensis TaxID=2747483 RepID=A0A8X6YUX5_9ARAC|nr:hypothetical protein TNIN_498531 [Trichonephila inaurata madagascariensis]